MRRRTREEKPEAVFGRAYQDHRSDTGRWIFSEQRGALLDIHPGREDDIHTIRTALMKQRRKEGYKVTERKVLSR